MPNIEDTDLLETRWLNLLIAAPWQRDTAMLNDLVAMEKSLRSRGIPDLFPLDSSDFKRLDTSNFIFNLII